MSERKALIVDDEPDARAYLTTVLTDNGWQAESASNGDEGLEVARRQRPDVILLDVMMPERGGLSTLVAIRKDETLAATPVVLVTGIQEGLSRDFESFLDRFKKYHPDGYLEKPVKPEQLMAALEKVAPGE
jgi:CheY-like chemotaxis protein